MTDEKAQEATQQQAAPQEQEKPVENAEQGSEPQTTSIIDSANKAAERLAAENKKFEDNIARLERLRAFEKLGGKSMAGNKQEKSAEDLAQEEAERALKRFGMK